jgi:hypothetical protein
MKREVLMEDRIHTPRPHLEGLYRPDQPRAAGIYGEVHPAPATPASEDPDD